MVNALHPLSDSTLLVLLAPDDPRVVLRDGHLNDGARPHAHHDSVVGQAHGLDVVLWVHHSVLSIEVPSQVENLELIETLDVGARLN